MPTSKTTMTKSFFVMGMIACASVMSEKITSSNGGIRASNVLGSADEHASFSFVRPGLTQTSYSFNGPSSHQSFSSSIGNLNLAYRVSPNVAQALAYRNPGLETRYSIIPHSSSKNLKNYMATSCDNYTATSIQGIMAGPAPHHICNKWGLRTLPRTVFAPQVADDCLTVKSIMAEETATQRTRHLEKRAKSACNASRGIGSSSIQAHQNYFLTAATSTGYANSPYVDASSGFKSVISGLPSSGLVSTTAYADQNQQYQRGEINREAQTQLQQQLQQYPDISIYQAHLNQLLAANQQQQHQAQLQSHGEPWKNFAQAIDEFGRLQVPEQVKLQQSQYPREPSQNLLGVAYSSAPSVAHGKVSGNGYKFNF